MAFISRQDALNRLRAQGTVRIPWRDTRWRDALGVDHVSHDRDWGRALASGVLEATEPVDVLPWLPPALLARLGDEPEARTRFRVQIDRARLGDLTHAEGSARIDQLALRAGGIPAGLSPAGAGRGVGGGGAVWGGSGGAGGRGGAVAGERVGPHV